MTGKDSRNKHNQNMPKCFLSPAPPPSILRETIIVGMEMRLFHWEATLLIAKKEVLKFP